MENEKPLVSVIIPMYNTEKFVAECLESILAQTLENFEVIVVDDCSTDRSVEIVASYAPRFGGRLQLLRTDKNSGYGSIPRNKGLEFATGKYVYFVDSDDALTTDALENLYVTAERIQADVLICKKYLTSTGVGEKFLQEIVLKGDKYDNGVELVTDNLEVRFKVWRENSILSASWLKFIKREFLLNNNINFLPVMQEDSIWTFELMFSANKIVLVPNVCYIYRQRQNSVNSEADSTELTPNTIYKKFDRVINGLKHVDEFMERISFFRRNPEIRFAVIDKIVMQNLTWIYNSYENATTLDIYKNCKNAFKEDAGKFDVLISYFVSSTISLFRNYVTSKDERKK